MTMHAIDTLAFAKKLKSAGYTEAQAEALAEAQAEVFREMLESTLASKDNLDDVETSLRGEITKLDAKIDHVETSLRGEITKLDAKIDHVETSLRGEIHAMGKDITIRLGGMIVAAVGVLAAIRYFG